MLGQTARNSGGFFLLDSLRYLAGKYRIVSSVAWENSHSHDG